MIAGKIFLEDHEIVFAYNHKNNTVQYTVTDHYSKEVESLEVPANKFFAALSIAVHNDGMPDYRSDYPLAESIMGSIRWIP